MLDPYHLNVWNNEWFVGHLWRNPQGWVGFRYDSEWINQGGFAISQTLPLQRSPFEPDDRTAHHFFANLLPEGTVREQIVRDLKIPDTIFDLLRAISGECAGALSILEVEHSPSTESSYQEITDDELAKLVARRGRGYTGNTKGRSRLSLAGAQNKCPILFRDGTYWLPTKESPSTHILKFELSDYRNIPAYETFTTWLAKAVGLPVVNIQLRSVSNTRFVLIERYDRNRFRDDWVERLHQEDLCQAMSFSHVRKYESDGGPGLADCGRLIKRVSTDPANDLLNLLRWQIFNVLAGNSDGHAKNLSLLYKPDGEVRLAPFYDLVCTRAIEQIDDRLALSVGTEKNPSLVALEHWETLALQCGVRPKFLKEQVQAMATMLLEKFQPTRQKFEDLYGHYGALQRIEYIVMKQSRRALTNDLK